MREEGGNNCNFTDTSTAGNTRQVVQFAPPTKIALPSLYSWIWWRRLCYLPPPIVEQQDTFNGFLWNCLHGNCHLSEEGVEIIIFNALLRKKIKSPRQFPINRVNNTLGCGAGRIQLMPMSPRIDTILRYLTTLSFQILSYFLSLLHCSSWCQKNLLSTTVVQYLHPFKPCAFIFQNLTWCFLTWLPLSASS